MIHRHINSTGWTRMAIESLFERGDLADWREFAAAMKSDRQVAVDTIAVCGYHSEPGAVAIARTLIEHFYPALAAQSTSVARG